MSRSDTTRKGALGLFDLTSLVIGAVIGADIYVVASLGAGLLGPAQLVAWVAAGVMAACIAIGFAQCAAIVTRVGGSYAYAREAFGHFPGFIVGWALYLAEWINCAIFPIAFVQYLGFFFPHLTWWQSGLAKAAFVGFLLLTNLFGTQIAGRANDILAVGKLAPLAVLVLAGIIFVVFLKPAESLGHLAPFAPFGWGNFGPAIILVFWAYAGFELAVIPAGEVREPRKTLPRAFFLGMAVSTFFYLVVNAMVTLIVDENTLAHSTTPLAQALGTVLQGAGIPVILGGGFMAFGAMLSISGADESDLIGTSRLGYAMAHDGYFPRFFGKLHPKWETPYLSLIFQGTTALGLSLFGELKLLISVSVVFLGIAYAATCVAALRLSRSHPDRRLKLHGTHIFVIFGILSSLYLISQAGLITIGVSVILLGVGLGVFRAFTPKKELEETKGELEADKATLIEIRRFLEASPVLVWRRLLRSRR